MIRSSFQVLPLLALAALSGCAVRIGRERTVTVPPPAGPLDAALVAEIDAVGKLSFDSDRLEHLLRLATRPAIGEGEMRYLLDVSHEVLSFSSSKTKVVMAVIDSPHFGDALREHIARNLDELVGWSDRERVLQALDRRVREAARPVPASAEVETSI